MLRHEFVGDEAPRLLFEQHEVFGHPGRTRKIEGIHSGDSLRQLP